MEKLGEKLGELNAEQLGHLIMELSQEQIRHLLAIKDKADKRIEMRREAQKRYYQRNKERIKAYSKKYQDEHYVHKRQQNTVMVE